MNIRHIGPRLSGMIAGIAWLRGQPVEIPDGVAAALLEGGREVEGGKAVSPEWEIVPKPAPEKKPEKE